MDVRLSRSPTPLLIVVLVLPDLRNMPLDSGAPRFPQLCCPHLSQPHERRLVLLLERDNGDDTQPLAAVAVDLLPRLDHHRVGRLTEVVPVGRVEPVPEHRSSVPGPDGAASLSATFGGA